MLEFLGRHIRFLNVMLILQTNNLWNSLLSHDPSKKRKKKILSVDKTKVAT